MACFRSSFRLETSHGFQKSCKIDITRKLKIKRIDNFMKSRLTKVYFIIFLFVEFHLELVWLLSQKTYKAVKVNSSIQTFLKDLFNFVSWEAKLYQYASKFLTKEIISNLKNSFWLDEILDCFFSYCNFHNHVCVCVDNQRNEKKFICASIDFSKTL